MPAIIDTQKLSRIKYIVMVFHCRVVKILYVDNFLLGGDKCGFYHRLINLKFISKIIVMHFRHNSEISVNVNGIPIANYFCASILHISERSTNFSVKSLEILSSDYMNVSHIHLGI